jgi:endo-1,4-beta-mannosidase
MAAEPFALGVNYWPRRKAMYWWSGFEPAEVRDEFSLIREIGLQFVRIFLLWEDWQPTPTSVSPAALDNFESVCNIAADLGLRLDVTFFTGHMSGPSWVPNWMLRDNLPTPSGVRQVVSGQKPVQCGYANPFVDPVALEAAGLLLRTVVARFKDHPAIGLWNLGNEPDLFAHPPNAASGRAWAHRMTRLIHDLDLAHPVTCGLHTASLYGKPREQYMVSEEALAEYFEQVLPKLLEVGALGAMLWCFADYVPELYHRPPCDEAWHERFFGLVRPDGSLKPHAAIIKRFAATKPSMQPGADWRFTEAGASSIALYRSGDPPP